MMELKLKVSVPVRIVVVSDLHVGHKGFKEEVLNGILNELEDPNTYFVLAGDLVEGREPSHKFYNSEENGLDVGMQYAYVFNKLRPYASKCLGCVIGNHEYSLVSKTTINPTQQFCTDNRIPYGGNCMRLIFTSAEPTVEKEGEETEETEEVEEEVSDFVPERMSMIITHGAGGGKVGSALNKAIDYGKSFNADMVVMGHFHRLAHAVEMKPTEDEEGFIRWKPMDIVLNGCAIDGYAGGTSSYAERMMLTPTILGYAVITLDPTNGLARYVQLKPFN